MAEETVAETDLRENPLSEREMDVAELLATGASNSEIARDLSISPHTVKVHVRNIYDKLQVSSRTEASMLLVQHGWIVVPGMSQPAVDAVPQIPPPAPLADRPEEPALWQSIWMVATLAVLLLAFWLPSFLQADAAFPDLLTDSGYTSLGQPILAPQPRWEARTPLTEPRSRMAFVRDGDLLYSIGGESNGAASAEVAVYDLNVNAWEVVAPLPRPLANMAAAALNGRIYAAGGSNVSDDGVTISADFLRYGGEETGWEALAALPQPLAGAALVAAEDALYLLGGWDGAEMHDEVWRLAMAADGDPAGNWELAARLPAARAFFGSTVVDGELYVVGGHDGQQELREADAFSLDEGTWRQLPPLSTPRGGLTLIYDDLAIFALGGGWTYPIRTHERYDPAINVWSNFPSPIQGQWRHLGAAAKDGQLHLVGGWSGAYLDSHYQYQSTFRALLPVITND